MSTEVIDLNRRRVLDALRLIREQGPEELSPAGRRQLAKDLKALARKDTHGLASTLYATARAVQPPRGQR